MVSSSVILVNEEWMSNEAIYKLVSLLRISFENENKSLTVYSLTVNSLTVRKILLSFTSRYQWLKGLFEVNFYLFIYLFIYLLTLF